MKIKYQEPPTADATPAEIMRMDLSPWLDERVIEDANRRCAGIQLPTKTADDWEFIAKPLGQRYDTKLLLRKAILSVWLPERMRASR